MNSKAFVGVTLSLIAGYVFVGEPAVETMHKVDALQKKQTVKRSTILPKAQDHTQEENSTRSAAEYNRPLMSAVTSLSTNALDSTVWSVTE